MTILKSVRDGKYVAVQKGYYFREKTAFEAITKLLAFIKSNIKEFTVV